MKYTIGDVFWISTPSFRYKKTPIKIMDVKWYECVNEFRYTLVNARDDAARDENGRKYCYYESENGMDKLIHS